MKILRVVASVDPSHGGVTEAVRSTTKALQDLGHSVDVVSLDDPTDAFLTDFPARTYAVGRWMRRYGYTPKLSQWISENGRHYDVGVVEGLWNHASIGGAQGMSSASLPYIVFPHGMMDPWFKSQYPLKHLAKQLFWWTFQGRVLGKAAAVAFTCEEEKRLARGVFLGPGYKEEVISLGIGDAPEISAAARRSLIERLPALAGKPYLLFMSRLHPKKGCDLLIRAFSELAQRDPDIQLVMAGPDQVGWMPSLQELARSQGIEPRVHWPGMLEADAKWAAIYGCDAFVLPSHQENFGIVVAEAMACGKAVLTTDKVNIWREIQATGGGLIEANTIKGISRLLERWSAMSSEERSEMAISARKGFTANFHIDSAVRNLECLLQNVARRAS